MSLGEKLGNFVGIVLFIVCFPITVPIYMCSQNTVNVEEPQLQNHEQPQNQDPQPAIQYKNGKPYPRQEHTPNEIAAGVV
jgi:hypothetical protein